MVPALLVLGALVVGGMAAGRIMRAESGRGTPRPTSARRCAPPYDWERDGL